MSLTVFSSELKPEPAMRQVVQWFALVAVILGLIIIVSLPLAAVWRCSAGLLWSLFSWREWRQVRDAHARFERIRIDCNGAVELVDYWGERHNAAVVSGSVLLQGCGWLRFKLEDGGEFGELLRGDSRENEHWRRLQVIWRHLGTAA